MPEGPEVKTIVDQLNIEIVDQYLIDIMWTNESKHGKDLDYQSLMLPMKIISVECKGKMIFFKLIRDDYISYIYCHLNMTGKWSVKPKTKSYLWFEIGQFNDSGYPNIGRILKKIYFTDVRKMAKLIVMDESQYFTKLNSVGPDLLSDDVSFDQWYIKLQQPGPRTKSTNITKFLMKQEYFSGIGNYLKAEILYESKISPYRETDDISYDEAKILFDNIIKIIKLSYEHGGKTLSDFVDMYNNEGTFECKVYGRDISIDNYKVIKDETPDKRTTHWCPDCQF